MKKESGARKATRLLTGNPVYLENDNLPIDAMNLVWVFFIALIVGAITLLMSCQAANASNKIIVKGYSNEQICNAIEKAENGNNKNPKYPYGIHSVKCESKEACRQVCINTVRNNRKRYAANEDNGKITFIEFLGSRFCPTTGKLSKSESKPNVNWVRNVNFFLKKDNG